MRAKHPGYAALLKSFSMERVPLPDGPMEFYVKTNMIDLFAQETAPPSLAQQSVEFRAWIDGVFREMHRQIAALDPNPLCGEDHAARLMREDAIKCVKAAAAILGVNLEG